MTVFSPKFWVVPLLLFATSTRPTTATGEEMVSNAANAATDGERRKLEPASSNGDFLFQGTILYAPSFFNKLDNETQKLLSQPVHMCVGECVDYKQQQQQEQQRRRDRVVVEEEEDAENNNDDERDYYYLRTTNSNSNSNSNNDQHQHQHRGRGLKPKKDPVTINLEWIPCAEDAYWLEDDQVLTYAYRERLDPAPLPAIDPIFPLIDIIRINASEVNRNFAMMPDPWFENEDQCGDDDDEVAKSPFTKIGMLPSGTGFFEAFFENDQDPTSPSLPDVEASVTIVGFTNFTVFLPFLNSTGAVSDIRNIVALAMYGTDLPAGPVFTFPKSRRNPEQILFAEVYFNTLVDWTLNEGLDNSNGLATFYNLEQVLLHEAGHTLGLAHNQGTTPAPDEEITVMNESYQGGEFTTLLERDIKGICQRFIDFEDSDEFEDNCGAVKSTKTAKASKSAKVDRRKKRQRRK